METGKLEKIKLILSFSAFFILFFLSSLSNSKKGRVIHLKNMQSGSFQVETDYGTCTVIHCGSEICADGPNAKCESTEKLGSNNLKETESKCVCNDGYITYEEDDIFLCCYKQKDGMTALLLEFFLGFGVGHLYLGNFFMGYLKASIYSVFFLFSIYILLKLFFKRDENESTTFFFKVTSKICLLLCSCTYIGWQIVDSILFSIGAYTDGNGAALYIS